MIAVAALALLGAGCGKTNPTPFRPPTGGPPVSNAPAFPDGGPGGQTPAPPQASAYLIALDGTVAAQQAAERTTSKPIGCNDYAVPVTLSTPIRPTAALLDTMTALLAVDDKTAETLGYMTALAKGTLAVKGVSAGPDGRNVVELTGSPMPSGECDDPRIKAQIELTAAQFGPYEIRLNGSSSTWRCVGDLSGKCE